MKTFTSRRGALLMGLAGLAGVAAVTAVVSAATSAAISAPAIASSRRSLPLMSKGPFYPPRAWRERWESPDNWDADLTRVQRDGQMSTARGEILGLQLSVVDTQDRIVDNAEIEIWQCDALAHYHHPSAAQTAGRFDPNFQGFGATRSASDGTLRFRTIKPVPYPGRTPHIHVLLRHPSFGEMTSQLFIAGDAGNARDFLWRRLAEVDRSAVDLSLQAAPANSGLRWQAQQRLVVPA